MLKDANDIIITFWIMIIVIGAKILALSQRNAHDHVYDHPKNWVFQQKPFD